MEGRTITLPVALTATNSKELLRECRRTLYKEPLNLDGSSLTRMDYSGDAFFALLADLSEKTGNKLTLAHFNEEIKAQLRALKKEKIPEKVKTGYSNFLEALGAKTIVIAKEVAEVFILLNMSIYWMICGPFDKGRSKFGGTAKQVFMLGTEATGICFLMVALICFTMALQSSFMLKAVGGGSYLASGLGYLIFADIIRSSSML